MGKKRYDWYVNFILFMWIIMRYFIQNMNNINELELD